MGIFDSQQEKNERIARDGYSAGRNSSAMDRWTQHNIVEATRPFPGHAKEEDIYAANFRRGELDQAKFGRDKPPQVPLETRAEEPPESSSDDSDGEISDEAYEALAGMMIEALQELREERKAERLEDARREREYAERARLDAIESKKRAEVYDPIDRLYALPLRELAEKESHRNTNEQERGLAIAVRIARKSKDLPPEILWKHIMSVEPKDASQYAIYRGWREGIKRVQDEREKARERLFTSSEQERYEYIKNHPGEFICLKLSQTITRKAYLQDLARCSSLVDADAIYGKLQQISERERKEQIAANVMNALEWPFEMIRKLVARIGKGKS